jgi:NAD(P)-dependent dehydrogenase (short-subunit alcohol dehydrogenase family)
MSGYQDKLYLVVGAYSGIGRSVMQRLSRQGAMIVAVGRDENKLREALQPLPGKGHQAVTADASNWEQLQGIVEIGRKAGGYAGGVVCAGMHEARPLAVLDAAALARSFEANVTTAILSTRVLAKSANKEGCSMVWISSVAAMRGTAAFGAYAAAKGALISAARVMAVELASRRIRVNVVAAGVVRTAMSDKWLSLLSAQQQEAVAKSHPLGIGQPEDVAGPIAFLLSGDSRWMTGSVITVDGGLSAQ